MKTITCDDRAEAETTATETMVALVAEGSMSTVAVCKNPYRATLIQGNFSGAMRESPQDPNTSSIIVFIPQPLTTVADKIPTIRGG